MRVIRCNYRARSPKSFTGRGQRPDTDQLEQLRDHLRRVEARLAARKQGRAA